ncbi:MAG: S-layer homology domain-containing protein, partial [Acidimicrobiales bacterium]
MFSPVRKVAAHASMALVLVVATFAVALAEAPGSPAAATEVSAGVPLRATALSTSTGREFCAMLENGELKCWSALAPVENGNDLAAIDLGSGRTAAAVASGRGHTCALLDDGAVKCWGDNSSGQLGLGDTTVRDGVPPAAVPLGTGRTATEITTGASHTCAVLDTGAIKCWGSNLSGQLGLGDTDDRGDDPGEMGDDLPAVELGAAAITVAGGYNNTCALLVGGQVKCWGVNSNGELGIGDVDRRGDDAGEMGNSLPAIDLGTGRTATAIAGAWNHYCAVLDNGAVKCWGSNADGRLGIGDTDNRGDDPGEMGDDLPAVDLGTGRTAQAIDGGDSSTCALLDNDLLKCWGRNNYGELGYGDAETRGDGPGEMGDDLPAVDLGAGRTIVSAEGGEAARCALLDNGRVKCWGLTFSGFIVPESGGLGDNLPPLDLGTRVVCPSGGTPFVDIGSSFARDDIACIYQLGITTGTSATTYDPKGDVTREQMAAFLGRLVANCPPDTDHGFTDVDPTSFADTHISCLKAFGITTGTSTTTYSPEDNVTREQMAAFIARMWRATDTACPTGADPFTDIAATSFAR